MLLILILLLLGFVEIIFKVVFLRMILCGIIGGVILNEFDVIKLIFVMLVVLLL